MSESTAKFQATISARDETSAVLARIAASTEALASRMGMLRTKERAAASEAPWMQMRGGIGGCSNAVGALTGRLTTMLPMLGGLGAGIGVGGIFTFTESMAKAGVESQDMAKRIGLSFDALQQYGYMAKMTNVPLESLTGGLTKLNRALGDAQMGKGEALKLFKALHVSLFDPKGGKRQTADVLNDVFLAWAKNPDPSIRESMAKTLFGRAGGDMADKIFGMDAAQRDKMAKDFARMYGTGPTREAQEGARRYNEAWLRTSFAVDLVRMRIGNELAPVLSPVLEQIEQFLTGNQTTIAKLAGGMGTGFADMMQRTDWKGIGRDIGNASKAAGTLLDDVGGINGAIDIMVGVKFVGWSAAFISAVAGMDKALVASAMYRFILGPGGALLSMFVPTNKTPTTTQEQQGLKNAGIGPPTGRVLTDEQAAAWKLAYPDQDRPLAGPRVSAPLSYYGGDVGLPLLPSPLAISTSPRALRIDPNPAAGGMWSGLASASGEVVVRFETQGLPPGVAVTATPSPGSRGLTVESPTGPAFPDYWLGY